MNFDGSTFGFEHTDTLCCVHKGSKPEIPVCKGAYGGFQIE